MRWPDRGERTLNLPAFTTGSVEPSCVQGTAPTGYGLTIVSRREGVTCYTFAAGSAYEGAYLSLSGIRQAVLAAGGQLETLSDGQIRLNLGDSKVNLPPNFSVGGERYFLAAAVASGLYNGQSDNVQLTGYARPTLHLGKLTLNFGDGSLADFGKAYYRGLTLELLGAALMTPDSAEGVSYSVVLSDPSGTAHHRVQTGLKPGEVVMLATLLDGRSLLMDSAPVAADGTVTLDMPQTKLRFVSDPTQLTSAPADDRTPALLVRVTNIPLSNLKSGIFVPAQATSDLN